MRAALHFWKLNLKEKMIKLVVEIIGVAEHIDTEEIDSSHEI